MIHHPTSNPNPLAQFSPDSSTCSVRLGHTLAIATIQATLEPPYPGRYSEGSVRFEVTLSPLPCMPDQQRSSATNEAIEAARLIERGLRESRAIDLEGLCIQAGRRVWHLFVSLRVMDTCGNSIDAAGLAALGALCSFRRPDVTIDAGAQGGIVIHPVAEREAVGVTMHHLPSPVTFAFFDVSTLVKMGSSDITTGDGGILAVIDPSREEEAASHGTFTLTVNPQGELCAAQKSHGIGVTPARLKQCVRMAVERVKDSVAVLKRALESHESARVAARVQRRRSAVDHGDGRGILVGWKSARGGIDVNKRAVVVSKGSGASSGCMLESLNLGEDRIGMDGISGGGGEEKDNDDEMVADDTAKNDEEDITQHENQQQQQASQAEKGASQYEKKAKRRRRYPRIDGSNREDRNEQFAAIADMIACAKDDMDKDGAEGLSAALKRKK